MLKTFINTVPFTKFILIADSLENRDIRLFDYLVKRHIKRNQLKIHYCVFEGVFTKAQDKFQSYSNIVLHNFVCNSQGPDDERNKFDQLALRLSDNDIIIVDSLANAIFRYGLPHTYRIFNSLRTNKAIKQIISVLHKDLIEEDYSEVTLFFTNLSTLFINIQPKFMTDGSRLKYEYKKSGGKVISEIEEFRFEGEELVTSKIVHPDPSKLLEKSISKEVNPEELSTFRIGLTDEEKLSRDKLVLPYLPNAKEENLQQGGKIFYQLDAIDDWDEEDPDDDLEI